MLVARNIHKSYGKLQVLKGIDLEVTKGEVISIVGASGAGKSTLLHILGTLDRPDQGTVQLRGLDLFDMKNGELAKVRNENVGFVFQFHNLLPEFSALENVCMPGFISNKDKSILTPKADELLKILGINGRSEHKPSQLSGGEQQRVAVARALINEPDIVFADEPSGNLDSKNAEDLHSIFFKLREELDQTFVIVTHNDHLADMADRKIELVDGRIKA